MRSSMRLKVPAGLIADRILDQIMTLAGQRILPDEHAHA